jgi:hypothetical protein
MKKIALIGSLVLTLGFFPDASTAAVITFTDTLPSSNVMLSNASTGGGNNRQFYNYEPASSTSVRWVGVGFQAPSATSLDQATFFLYNDQVSADDLNAQMTISIVSLSTLTGAPSTPFTPLYSETGMSPSSYNGQNYITFDLDTPYALAADNFYGIVLSFDDPSKNRFMSLFMAGTPGNGMRGSEFYTNSFGATWTTDSISMDFVLQTVPEPTSSGLLGAATIMGGLVWFRRSRRNSTPLLS